MEFADAFEQLDAYLEEEMVTLVLTALERKPTQSVGVIRLTLHQFENANPDCAGTEMRSFEVRCRQLESWNWTTGYLHCVRLESEHPALVPFEQEWARLSYRGQTSDPERLRLAITDRYRRTVYDSGHPGEYLNGGADFALPYGTVATGPRSLVDALSDVLTDHGVEPLRTATDRRFAEPAPASAPLSVLVLGESWFVAEAFEVHGEIPTISWS